MLRLKRTERSSDSVVTCKTENWCCLISHLNQSQTQVLTVFPLKFVVLGIHLREFWMIQDRLANSNHPIGGSQREDGVAKLRGFQSVALSEKNYHMKMIENAILDILQSKLKTGHFHAALTWRLIDRIDFGKVISIQNIEADILAQRY